MKTTTQPPAQSPGNNDDSSLPPSDMKHTPTPYTLSVEDHAIEIRCGSHVVADVYIPQVGCAGPRDMAEAGATAAFIVRACNSYESSQQTIARLRGALERIKNLPNCGRGYGDRAWNIAQSALASTPEGAQ